MWGTVIVTATYGDGNTVTATHSDGDVQGTTTSGAQLCSIHITTQFWTISAYF